MGFSKAISVLNKYKKIDSKTFLTKTGTTLISELKLTTPIDTGETQAAWSKEIIKTDSGYDLIISNSAHSEIGIPLPILIKYGHGTGNGGYVPPNDFMAVPFEKATKNLDKIILKEIK